MPIRNIMIKKSLSLKKKSAKKKKCNIRRKKNLSRRNLKSRNKRGGSAFDPDNHKLLKGKIIELLSYEPDNHKLLQNKIIELAKIVGIECNPDESNEYKSNEDKPNEYKSNEYNALESLIKEYPDSNESPLNKSYTLEYQSRDGNGDYYTKDSDLIKTILGGSKKNIGFDSPMLTVKTKYSRNYGDSENYGVLTTEGKKAFRDVANQGSLNGQLDKHFSELNRIM